MSFRFAVLGVRLGGWTVALLLAVAPPAQAETRVLLVSGDPGTEAGWAARFDDWRGRWQETLTKGESVPAGNIRVLRSHGNSQAPSADSATRENVLAACGAMAKESTAKDHVLVIFIGHAYRTQAENVRIALPGPDLADDELAAALKPIAAKHLVAIMLTPEGEGLAKALAGPNRVIIAANVKQSAPVFGEFLLRASSEKGVTLLGAFNKAAIQTTAWYQNQFIANGSDGVTVHGKEFQEVFRRMYPGRKMIAGKDTPQPAVNDPTKQSDWLGRRVVPETAGLDDNGDGELSTVFAAGGKEPSPLPNKDSQDGALAKKLYLGHE